MPDRRPLAAVLAALAVAVVALTAAWLGKERPFAASVPQPPPLEQTELIGVPAGATACLRGVTFLPRSRVATLHVGTRGRPPVPLRWTARGDGYAAQGDIARTWVDNGPVPTPIAPPRRAVHGDFCVRNGGRTPIDLYAAGGESRTVSTTDVDGRRQAVNFELALSEAAPRSVAARAGTVAGDAAAFKPVGAWLVWLVAVLAVAGIPALLGFALWRSAGERGP